MKTQYLAFAAFAALTAAAPAAAQYSSLDPYAEDGQFDNRLDQLQDRIDSATQRGTVSPAEAAGLRNQLWDLRQLERDYRRNGFNDWERSDLQTRLSALWSQTRDRQTDGDRYGYGGDWNDRDNNGYDDSLDRDGNGYDDRSDSDGDGYADSLDRNGDGYNDQYDRDDNGYDDRLDRNGDGYDDRSPDTANPFDPDYYDGLSNDPGDETDDGSATGSPDPYESSASATLRVGDQAPDTLSPVPPEYRSLYRDGSGVVYRYGNGAVYQIDGSGIVRWVGRLPE